MVEVMTDKKIEALRKELSKLYAKENIKLQDDLDLRFIEANKTQDNFMKLFTE